MILATIFFIDYCNMLKIIVCNLEFALESLSVLLCSDEQLKPGKFSEFIERNALEYQKILDKTFTIKIE